jgi:hypothetical protein
MSVDYHGVRPVTKDDQKIAKKHLKKTEDLVDEKIDDHENAKEDAQEAGNTQSAAYHDSHMKNHQKEKSDIEKSLKTLKNSKPAVIMPVKKSAGLDSFAKKKRLMASAMKG